MFKPMQYSPKSPNPVLLFGSNAKTVLALVDTLASLGLNARFDNDIASARIGAGDIIASDQPGMEPGLVHAHLGDSATYVHVVHGTLEKREAGDQSTSQTSELQAQNHALLMQAKSLVIEIDADASESGLERLLTLFGQEAKVLSVCATWARALEQHDEASDMSAQSLGLLGESPCLRRELARLRTENAQLTAQLHRVYRSRVFDVFDLWRYSRQSMSGMFKFPIRALPLIFKRRRLRVSSSSDRRGILETAREMDGQSQAVAETALDQLTKRQGNTVSQAAHLLRANLHLDNATEWCKHINHYFAAFGLQPVCSVETGPKSESRFLMLESTVNQTISGPTISVIMPAFNAGKTLHFAAQSVLNQTWRNVQLIIVDDNSDDDTFHIAKTLAELDERVLALRNTVNVGPYVSKNRALKHCNGTYITGHDADDWAHPERLERQVAPLVVRKANATLCCMYRMQMDGRVVRFGVEGNTCPDGAMRVASITAMFSKAFFESNLGAWDSVRFAADSELIARSRMLLSEDAFVQLNEPLMICLEDAGSLTNNPVTGIDPVSGMSSMRSEYRANWLSWHQRIDRAAQCRMDFPLKHRPFLAPEHMRVPNADAEAVMAEQSKRRSPPLDIFVT